MEFQLIIQLLDEHYGDIDLIADIEDKLDSSLINVDAEVDGHDIGCGEVNIFVHTNALDHTFKTVKYALEKEHINLADVKIGYRMLRSEEYLPLWPEHLTEFDVK